MFASPSRLLTHQALETTSTTSLRKYHHHGHLSFRSRCNAQNDSFQEIVGYLERQYDDILAEESRIIRNARFRDNRVHALLYFIPPTGHAYVLNPFCYVVPLDP